MNEKLMEKTLELSMINAENNFTLGGPFGALITDENKNIIATGYNKVINNTDPTAHAEINAIRNACEKLNTHDLSGHILYTSCYPCPMCLGAIMWANIKTVYYGNTKEDAENIGFKDNFIYEYIKGNNTDSINIVNIGRNNTIKAFEEFKNNKNKRTY